jgi:hypothetical protein
MGNTEVTPQAIWTIAKSLLKGDEPRAPNVIHGPLCLIFHPSEKANAIVDCLENQFIHYDLCNENMNGEWRLAFKLCSKPWTKSPLRE